MPLTDDGWAQQTHDALADEAGLDPSEARAARTCSVPDCYRPMVKRGMCGAHVMRVRRTGSIGTTPIADPTVRSQEDRFWAKVDRRGVDECWEWTGALTSTGYGALRPAGRRAGPAVKAHRYSAELAGMDVAGKFILRSCDNPKCVNPEHLRPGTQAENVADMIERGRMAVGSTRASVLTEPDIPVIRSLRRAGLGYKDIAQRFGVEASTIGHVIRGATWRHVPDDQAGAA